MLFQRLYNWIKYKTLPSSFLFKNRLFIERDSKHRRIFNNFGLVFRNSKWSNYENYNIKMQFKSNYIKYLNWSFFFILSFFLLYNFNNYYIHFYFFNSISFIFWISIDTLDYYVSFIAWLFTILTSLLFNLIYSYFFFNNFSSNNEPKDFFSNKFFFNTKLAANVTNNNLKISKHDLNWVLYAWLANNNSHPTSILENLFNNECKLRWWDNYSNFFINLYRLTYFFKLSDKKNNTPFLQIKLQDLNLYKKNFSTLLNFCDNTYFLNKFSSVIGYYILTSHKNYFLQKNRSNFSLNFLNKQFDWNLQNFNIELQNYPFLLKTKTGLFFFDNFTYEQFSYFIFNIEELWGLNFFIKNQLNVSKWNRWLYKYSILHRKVLKNSHKITLSKRLLNSGFYSKDLFNKNIWASENFNKYNKKMFDSFSNLYYNDSFLKSNNLWNNRTLMVNNQNKLNSLKLFSFYEQSYFWFLKRFYFFNTLPNNFIKSGVKLPKLVNSGKITSQNNNNKYNFFFSYLIKSYNLNFYNLSLNSDNYAIKNIFSKPTVYDFSSNYGLKDLYLSVNEYELLSKDNLNILYWLTSAPTNLNNDLMHFNYLNTLTFNQNIFTSNTFKKVIPFNNEIMLQTYFYLYNKDGIFLNDFTYLSLYY